MVNKRITTNLIEVFKELNIPYSRRYSDTVYNKYGKTVNIKFVRVEVNEEQKLIIINKMKERGIIINYIRWNKGGFDGSNEGTRFNCMWEKI